jgi:hypothetical protein
LFKRTIFSLSVSREAGKQSPATASDITGVEARLESTELGTLRDARQKLSVAAAVEAAAIEAPGETQRDVSTEEVHERLVVVVLNKENAP